MSKQNYDSPYHIGAKDKHYGVKYTPRYYVQASWEGKDCISEDDMTAEQIAEYEAGYNNCTTNREEHGSYYDLY